MIMFQRDKHKYSSLFYFIFILLKKGNNSYFQTHFDGEFNGHKQLSIFVWETKF